MDREGDLTTVEPAMFWARVHDALAQVSAADRTPPPQARVGAVLVLVEESEDGLAVVLTRRRRDMRSHPGQVSFPGGRLDPGETIEQAALREAEEEIGLRPHTVEVIGTGPTFYLPPSRFWVAPVLARWREPHPLAENPWEVDEVLRVPFGYLLAPDRWRSTPLSSRSAAWAWQLDDDLLWGATAMVVATLLDATVEGWNRGLDPADLDEDRVARPWEDAPVWERRARLEGELPALAQRSVPHADATAVRAARSWLDRHGVGSLARAEHAGRALAHAVRRLYAGALQDVVITVLAGPSSNGAGGLAAARMLLAAGADVEVVSVGAPRHAQQLHLLQEAGVTAQQVPAAELRDARPPGAIVIDAMLGIGTRPPLRDLPDAAAHWLQRYDVPVVALDLPSGLSADHGLRGPCVTADVTVATGLPARGLRAVTAHPYVGDLYLADLGIPPAAWEDAGVRLPSRSPFAAGPLVRLTADGGQDTDRAEGGT